MRAFRRRAGSEVVGSLPIVTPLAPACLSTMRRVARSRMSIWSRQRHGRHRSWRSPRR
jgi:hypothetical protein